ncbi:hypothetical protein BUALT_Bualt15G0108400 [Buddleja alternifolia]|uniref:X8 domain-containing protein n=1 Tax=Buddleja alternifolia TaxID=168488 RepID=A0AAV6WMH5_9LAMI|nr:hypothetical protein BUALT_Bualt15G0108400 [Buddleja alternifolia]
MEKNNICLFVICCILVVTYAYDTNSKAFDQKQAGDWCISQEGAPDDKMQAFMIYACGVAYCEPIQAGAPCFDPNTVKSHANYALDIIYRKNGDCNTGIGTKTTVDPSYGNCKYP